MVSSTLRNSTLQNQNTLLLGQKRVLEMVATGAPLADTLAELALFIEAQEPGMRCGILIVTDDGAHFRRGSGPHLPEAYHSALDGVPITPPYLGPCGQAAHRGIAIEVPDIATDPRWADVWREMVMSCGLAACRSTPVRGSDGRVLASFAMYYDRPRDPRPAHPQLIEIATHLAAIALERQWAEEAKRREARLRLLAREVDHRARNMLASVRAIARMTRAGTVPAFVDALMGRLDALSRVHALLTESRWAGADLERLVEEELAAYRTGGGRVTISGPGLALGADAAQVLAMALHELATNAAKYGALSAPGGRVAVEWFWDSDARLILCWTETGGPPIRMPRRRGFGSRMIEGAVEGQLDGAIHLDWPAEGLACRMTIPRPKLLEAGGGPLKPTGYVLRG